jgi:hypothetical protein
MNAPRTAFSKSPSPVHTTQARRGIRAEQELISCSVLAVFGYEKALLSARRALENQCIVLTLGLEVRMAREHRRYSFLKVTAAQHS